MRNNNFLQEIRDFVYRYYYPQVFSHIQDISNEAIEEISSSIVGVIKKNGAVLSFGNGGSDAIASQTTYALQKEIDYKYKFHAITNPSPWISADIDNHVFFSNSIRRYSNNGDLAILISASGNSKNIINAIKLCKKMDIKTVSISSEGKIVKDPSVKADITIPIENDDQQIIEDITLAAVFIIVKTVKEILEKGKCDIQKVKDSYLIRYQKDVETITPSDLQSIILDTISAYSKRKTVRIDAPDNGLIAISAGHIMHNFKWDGLSNIDIRPANKVQSGIPNFHLTGVGNDGGDEFNHAIEVFDNGEKGDVEIILYMDKDTTRTKSLIRAANMKKMKVHTLTVSHKDELISANSLMSTGHIMGRILNTYLLLKDGKIVAKQFLDQLKQDLALLRQKNETRKRYEALFLS